jgi:short-subunit dehydrogenase
MKGKVILITGASSGIGLALAKEFARQGSRLVIGARNTEALEKLKSELLQLGSPAVITAGLDVTQPQSCAAFVDVAVSQLGRIDVLVNNAGIGMVGAFDQAEFEPMHRVMDVNYWGTVYCSRYALPHLIQSKGSLVGISSIAGHVGLPGGAAYSSSKFAMEGLLATIRNENLHLGLHVLAASPGFTESSIRENAFDAHGNRRDNSGRPGMTKMMTAERCATLVYKAIVARKRNLVLTRQGILAVLLNKFVPWFVDNRLNQAFNKK